MLAYVSKRNKLLPDDSLFFAKLFQTQNLKFLSQLEHLIMLKFFRMYASSFESMPQTLANYVLDIILFPSKSNEYSNVRL